MPFNGHMHGDEARHFAVSEIIVTFAHVMVLTN
jgi:hypothetical protein